MDLNKFKYTICALFKKNKDYSSLEKETISLCKEFLIEKGYRVSPPIQTFNEIKNAKDLVNLFYNLYEQLCAEELTYSRNDAKDAGIAKAFLQSRMVGKNISKRRALDECALIIKTTILHKDSFSFDQPIGFWVFGAANCKWIADKAIAIINNEKRQQETIDICNKARNFEDSWKELKGYKDLDILLEGEF